SYALEHSSSFIFFIHAEVGIRDFHVTGVQTCALPICRHGRAPPPRRDILLLAETAQGGTTAAPRNGQVSWSISAWRVHDGDCSRTEVRRGGKVGRTGRV